MSTNDLSGALTKLVRAAEKAGIDPEQAAEEGRQLAAAIAESNRGAFVDWSAALGLPASAAAFFEAAQKGRRYRSSATPTASQASASGSRAAAAYRQALVEVCTAAALLGQAGPQSLGAAQLAAAAQRGAATPLRPSLQLPGAPAALIMDETQRRFERQAPTILNDVLQRLSASSERLLDLNRVDAHGPGAIPGLGATAPQFPTPQFTTPQLPPSPAPVPGTPAAGTPAPSATQPTEPAPADPPEPAEPEKTVEEWLAELDELVGLASVKSEIRRQTAILRVDALRTKAGLKSPTITRHLIFTGNPGTGKTTVARMVAGIYKAIGLLSKGQLVEVDRSELVAGYLGQTAMKTAEVVGKAIGGVLFIDEAYSLNGDQYGQEAINTLVKEMEDNRNDLVVIVAGYPAPMTGFISQNPGLASRFRTEIEFQDYTDEELAQIFTQMATKADYDLGAGCLAEFGRQLAAQVRDETFGNGRFARNVFEAAIGKHAWRLREIAEPTVEQLRVLLPEDLAPEPQPTVAWPASDEARGAGPRLMTVPLTDVKKATAGLTGRTGQTPRRLRLWQLAVAAMALLLGGVAAITMATLSNQLEQASAHAYQYVRAGDIQRQLLEAHAASARAFLARSDAEARSINQEAVESRETAATRIVEMAAHRTDLDGSLESLTHDVLRYTGLVDAAQQHRGEDTGRASLSAANKVLESALLPATEALQSAHLSAAQPAASWVWVLPVLAWLTVIGLVWISVLVAMASHRVFNIGLVLAAVITVLIAFGSMSMASGQASPNATTDGLSRVSALATAQRSGAQAYALAANSAATRAWTGDPAVALRDLISKGTQALDPSLDETLIGHLKELQTAGTTAIGHAKAHSWAAAEAAVLSVQPDAVGPASTRVQTQADADLTTALENLRTAASGQASVTVSLGVLSVIGAIGIAIAGIRGLNQRLKEYR